MTQQSSGRQTNAAGDAPLIEIRDLRVTYGGERPAVDGVSLQVFPRETVALVGESGSGKSTTALALISLLPATAQILSGSIRWKGETELLDGKSATVRQLRGREIGFIPQDPTVSLDPTQRVGAQVAEVLSVHGISRGASADARAVALLEEAGLPDAARRARQYPHELSGGMRQRVLIAIAWAAQPALIIADEPTSALDVTVQRQVLDRLEQLRASHSTSLVLVTHDLDVASERADKIAVMKDGRIVEFGDARTLLAAPQHDYTRRLVAARPTRAAARASAATVAPTHDDREGRAVQAPLLHARNLVKSFDSRRPDGTKFRFRAVDDVSFELHRRQTLAIVGESGSGKSTTARIAMRLERPDSGTVLFDGKDLGAAPARELRAARRDFQLVQQNPYSSLSPKWTLAQIISEPLRSFRVGTERKRRERGTELLERVGLPASFANRRPHELSGGQRQRVAIARALALSPTLIVLDEPVSALDVSVQAQILTLLEELQRDLGLSYLFISHDLAVVQAIADRVIVMRSGAVVEQGTTTQIFTAPEHEYTEQLIAAIPGNKRA